MNWIRVGLLANMFSCAFGVSLGNYGLSVLNALTFFLLLALYHKEL